VDIEYDSVKNTANLAKHGLSLDIGLIVLASALRIELDDRQDYRETRYNASPSSMIVCWHETHRVISVRKASRQEQRRCLS